MIAAAEASLAATHAELDASTAQLAALTARATQRDRERVRLKSHRATAAASATSSIATWREHLTVLGELIFDADPSTPGAEQLAADREAAARKRLEEARDVRRQTEAATKAASEAQAEVQLVQSTVDQLASRLADVGRQLTDLEATVERLRGSRAERVARQRELASSLLETVQTWIAALPAADRTRLADLAPAAEKPRARRGAKAADPGTHLDWIELDRARVALGELAAAWRARAEHVAEADATLLAALAAVERDTRDAERAVAEHAARLAEAERRRDELALELRDAAARLAEARADSGFDDDMLRSLLAAEPSRIDVLIGRLAELDRAVERALAVVSERARLVAEHAATRPPALSTDRVDLDQLRAP
ncbi:MAG: hypothetical protein WKG01_28890 [Kofleriaceae bacterium]